MLFQNSSFSAHLLIICVYVCVCMYTHAYFIYVYTTYIHKNTKIIHMPYLYDMWIDKISVYITFF